MPVCRNTPTTIIVCNALLVPGTWTVTRNGPLAVRLHKLRRLSHGRYTLTVRLIGHGINATMRRTVTIGSQPQG
jgi:hypothetical protein